MMQPSMRTPRATAMKTGAANIEDQFRRALALLDGLGVIDKAAEKILKDSIDAQMSGFLTSLLKTESGIVVGKDPASKDAALGALQSFLLGFASRSASRERLHVFTTNYDRLIEHGCDHAGLRIAVQVRVEKCGAGRSEVRVSIGMGTVWPAVDAVQ
jgi:hypothetical protein